jgi:hypothetical protein
VSGSLPVRKLTEQVLAKGRALELATLLEVLVPVARMRDLARKFGISPKGGFRIEKAPAHVLAPLLAELTDADKLEEVLLLLAPPRPVAAAPAAEVPADVSALLALREAELARTREELDRAREVAARGRERETELQRRVQQQDQELVLLRRQREAEAAEAAAAVPARPARSEPDWELRQQLRDLEDEREGFLAADAALRRQLAHNQSRMRELEESNAELEALLPKGRRRHRPVQPPPEAERRFRLPHFTPAFYKSLVGKERKAIERAMQAVLLFATEGHAYPGLEVKQLGGQDTWSLRASLGLRVYFRQIEDGDIEVLELADREDQHTTLRRLKERQ